MQQQAAPRMSFSRRAVTLERASSAADGNGLQPPHSLADPSGAIPLLAAICTCTTRNTRNKKRRPSVPIPRPHHSPTHLLSGHDASSQPYFHRFTILIHVHHLRAIDHDHQLDLSTPATPANAHITTHLRTPAHALRHSTVDLQLLSRAPDSSLLPYPFHFVATAATCPQL